MKAKEKTPSQVFSDKFEIEKVIARADKLNFCSIFSAWRIGIRLKERTSTLEQ